MNTGKTIICERCKNEIERTTNGNQKYCKECSQIVDKERKEKYWSKNKQKINEERNFVVEKIRSEIPNRSFFEWDNEVVGEEIAVMLKFPFTHALSKNHSWSMTRRGHVFLKKETKASMNLLIENLQEYKGKFKENKIWIELLIEKPNHKGDAINFVDRIADAIKKGIDIDDRWFSIKKVDWAINKNNPHIFLKIQQNNAINVRICSVCGKIKTLDNFNKCRSNKLGIGRECKDCSKQTDKLKRKQKKEINENGS